MIDVKLSRKLKEIGEWAFCDCSYLTHILLPKNLEKIGKGAFSCTPIERIVYRQFEENKKAKEEEKGVAKK